MSQLKMPISAQPARSQKANMPFQHWCEVCGAWGSFGYGAGRTEDARWFCGKHRDAAEKAKGGKL